MQEISPSLPTADADSPTGITMDYCPNCGRTVPVSNMRVHVAMCSNSHRQDFAEPESASQSTQMRDVIDLASDDNNDNDNDDDNRYSGRESDVRSRRSGAVSGQYRMTSPEVTVLRRSANRRFRERSSDDTRVATSALSDAAPEYNDTSDPGGTENVTSSWACPRCTLINPASETQCDACHYRLPRAEATSTDGTRGPDPVLRQRLVDPETHHESGERIPMVVGQQVIVVDSDDRAPNRVVQGHEVSAQPARMMSSGAVLGSLIGGATAYMRGRPLSSGVFEGAVTGAAGGAILGELVGNQQMQQRQATTAGTGNRQQQQQSSSTFDGEAIAQQQASNGSGRRIQIIRYGPGGNLVRTSRTLGDGSGGIENDLMMQMLLQSMVGGRAGAFGGDDGGGGHEGMSYEQLLSIFGDGTENRGASMGSIRSMPVTELTMKTAAALPEDKKSCSICLCDFEGGDKMKILPCLHGFHDECVDRWLESNGSCPVCKHAIEH